VSLGFEREDDSVEGYSEWFKYFVFALHSCST
jgi:hypothetical protein